MDRDPYQVAIPSRSPSSASWQSPTAPPHNPATPDATTSGAPPPAGAGPTAPRSTGPTIAMVIIGVVAAMFLLPMVLAAVVFGGIAGGGFGGVIGIVTILVLLVGALALVKLASNQHRAGRPPADPGLPAPYGATLYGIPAERGASLRERLRLIPTERRRIHVGLLWSLVGLVAVAGVGVLGGIVFGNVGTAGAIAGLVLLLGWAMTLVGYFMGGYRFLLPAAAATFLYGLLLHVDAVRDAWGTHTLWNVHAFLLWALFALAQAIPVEAAFRRAPRPLWAAWAIVGTVASAALPAGLALGFDDYPQQMPGILPALSVASMVWGLAAIFAFAPLPIPFRVGGIAVFALWAATIVAAMGFPSDFNERLQAAGLVAAAIVSAAALTAYFVLRPKPGGSSA